MYNAETWSVTAETHRYVHMFEMACFCKLLGVTRRDQLRNDATSSLNIKMDVDQIVQMQCLTYLDMSATCTQEDLRTIVSVVDLKANEVEVLFSCFIFGQQPCDVYAFVGAALQAVMDFFQILVNSGNNEVDFHRLFEVTTVVTVINV